MLDRRERAGDLLAGLLAMRESWAGELRTAMPGIIQSFDLAKKTCTVQPAIKAQVRREDGSADWVALPLLVDCPVQFPAGGGYVMSFPLKLGDEVLVVFGERCIDAWWQSGGIQQQAELRMHDLSDGFVIPCVWSQPRVVGAVHPDRAEFRDDEGNIKFSLDRGAGVLRMEALNASITVGGNVVNINGSLVVNGQAYKDHTHSGVAAGGATSGGVVGQP